MGSVTPAHRRALIQSKIERAKKNLQDMKESLVALHGNAISPERYIQPLKSTLGENIEYTVSFDSLAAAGDVVSNLRGSLDHLLYQLAEVRLGAIPLHTLKKLQFPICKKLATYKEAMGGIVEFIHPEAVKLIDELKPYKDGNEPLWLLNELNNISKHRMLLTIGPVLRCKAKWIQSISGVDTLRYEVDDPHFIGIYAKPADKAYFHVPGQESIGNPKVIGGEAMLPTLIYLVEYTESILQPFFAYF